jgi:hypothetical protein
MKQPTVGIASRALNWASVLALILGTLFLVGSAAASVDGPDAVRAMTRSGAACVAAAVALKVVGRCSSADGSGRRRTAWVRAPERAANAAPRAPGQGARWSTVVAEALRPSTSASSARSGCGAAGASGQRERLQARQWTGGCGSDAARSSSILSHLSQPCFAACCLMFSRTSLTIAFSSSRTAPLP